MTELFDVFAASVRDGFVQVSAFVAVTVLAFSYLQYRTDGRLVREVGRRERIQPLIGALMGLTPGCGGAIVMMPLYVRGTVSFGTVVATLVATAGDSAFVILALAPEAALYAYGVAFVAAVAFGHAVDAVGLGVDRVDRAVGRIARTATDGGGVGASGPVAGSGVHHYEGDVRQSEALTSQSERQSRSDDGAERSSAGSQNSESSDDVDETRSVSSARQKSKISGDDAAEPAASERGEAPLLTAFSWVALALWWVAAAVALAAGVLYLLRGAPDVPMAVDASFAGAFTVAGVAGTALSIYLYAVGRRYVGHGDVGRARDAFGSVRETLTHAAMETSFVTVWVLAAYLLYEYGVLFTGIDLRAVAAAAGLLAPVGAAVVGLIPGCGPQIVLATAYAEGALPFSALAANAISQDGDALFPLLAVDKRAAVVASVYTTIPALAVGVALHLLFGPMYGFGVLA